VEEGHAARTQDFAGARNQRLGRRPRRCAFCAAGGDCSGHLANGACPNSRLFAVLRQPRV